MRDLEDEARIKAYMAAKMKHIKMYNECMNLADGLDVEKFAELVRTDEREKVAQWMMKKEWERLEPMRTRIMSEAYDLADRGDSEGYNSVKVMCSDVLALIKTEIATERNALDLQTTIERGTKAWADVPDATEWVEELRGNVNEWVGLTVDEIDKFMPYCNSDQDLSEFRTFAFEIEAKLKEKNSGN